jgi:Fe-S-cluster containining protein
MSKQDWHGEGLRFECTGCGGCCTGEPGYVWVNKAEIEALARMVEMAVSEFQDTFLRRVGRRWSLKELPNGDCIFFETIHRRCTVYELRPRQCRTWPFWESNLRTEADWQETCRSCPGAGRGPIVSPSEIKARRGMIRV